MEPCPNCGFCPTCGRAPHPPTRYWPAIQPYWSYPRWTWSTTNQNTATITDTGEHTS